MDGALLESIIGQTARTIRDALNSDDKAVKKGARASTKAANAAFHHLDGVFLLGHGGEQGLTVYALPTQRAPLAELG